MPLVTTSVPASTKYSYKLGDTHLGVWAIQRAFNKLNYSHIGQLVEDGNFGPGTQAAVTTWQDNVNLTADGIFGPASQKRLVRSIEARVEDVVSFPAGLVQSQIDGEGGNLIAAVNHSVEGGVDCGYTQRRIYKQSNGLYRQTDIERAFDSFVQITLLAETNRSRKDYYIARPGVVNRKDKHEYAWRLAALYHNWPYGAQRLADGYALSNTMKASWVPAGTKFTDGTPVVTYAQWAKFYSMGAPEHNHKGQMVKYVTNWIA